MLTLLGVLAGAIGTGFVSALFPPVNAEAVLAVAVSVTTTGRGMVWVLGLAVGQTIGKVVVYEAARAGRQLHTWRRAKQAADKALAGQPTTDASPLEPASDSGTHRWRRFRAWLARVNQRLLALMDGRWRTNAVMLLSSSVGLPPLFLTTVLAGLIKQRRLDFIVCVLVGRLAHFAVIAAPFMALT